MKKIILLLGLFMIFALFASAEVSAYYGWGYPAAYGAYHGNAFFGGNNFFSGSFYYYGRSYGYYGPNLYIPYEYWDDDSFSRSVENTRRDTYDLVDTQRTPTSFPSNTQDFRARNSYQFQAYNSNGALSNGNFFESLS